jgi:hypothetical protein
MITEDVRLLLLEMLIVPEGLCEGLIRLAAQRVGNWETLSQEVPWFGKELDIVRVIGTLVVLR